MLIQFRVENHRSLRDEQVLNMVAADLDEKGGERLIHAEGLEHALLPAVAIYGANASGKSNVVGALSFMRKAVLKSHRLWEPEGGTPQEPFALSAKVNEPSLYEVDIVLEGTRFRYGFVLSAARVEEEWLLAWPRGRKKLLFERDGDSFRFAKTLQGENGAIRALTRPNSLFLSAAAQNNHHVLAPLFRWFARASLRIRQSSPKKAGSVASTPYLLDLLDLRQLTLPFFDSHKEGRKKAFISLLRAADIGVLDVKLVPKELASRAAFPSRAGPDVLTTAPHWPRRERAGTLDHELRFRHQTEDGSTEVWLPLSAESAGTITLVNLAADLLFALERGDLLAIDELEASLHPMLALEIVRLFNDPNQNPRGAQLIFTTHDTNLLGGILDEPALRRDQVWFTEKDRGGATHLYPLTDFHPRKEENLERGYLQGRYGAIPFLGRLVSVPEKKKTPEKKRKS
jgi:hypothetical protein